MRTSPPIPQLTVLAPDVASANRTLPPIVVVQGFCTYDQEAISEPSCRRSPAAARNTRVCTLQSD